MLKIGDDKGKWHYLALPSNLDEDGFRRPKKNISRLFEDILSRSHGGFYCYGCLRSFLTDVDLCKNNKCAKIEPPNEEK